MAYNYEYPGVDVQMYNADWLLHEMHNLKLEWQGLQDKWEQYKEEMAQAWQEYQEKVNQEWQEYKDNLNQEWDEYKAAQAEAWEAYKNQVNTIMTNFQTAIRQEWNTYKTELTHDWELFQQSIHDTNSEFQSYVNQQLEQYEIEYHTAINNFNQAWQAYQTTINNIVNTVKDLPDDWEAYKVEVNNEIAGQTEYINNYFNNLDITANLETALENKINDGSLTPIIGEAFNAALERRQYPVIAIIGDDPHLRPLLSNTIGDYVYNFIKQVYPNARVASHTIGFYKNNNAWESIKILNQNLAPNLTFTHVIALVSETPANYTSGNIQNLTSAIQKECPNAHFIMIATKLHQTIQDRHLFNTYWDTLVRNTPTGCIYDLRPWLNQPNIYMNADYVSDEWITQARHVITQSLYGTPGGICARTQDLRISPGTIAGTMPSDTHLSVIQTDTGVNYCTYGAYINFNNPSDVGSNTILFRHNATTGSNLVCYIEDRILCTLELSQQAGGSFMLTCILHIIPNFSGGKANVDFRIEGFHVTYGEIISARMWVCGFSPYGV